MIPIFLAGLAILFIGLKLTGHIVWSWWWVTAPVWSPVALLVFLWLLGLALERIGYLLMTPQQRKVQDLQDAFENMNQHLKRR